MFADVDLRELAEMTGPERAFLSVYISEPQSVKGLDKRFERLRRALAATDSAEKDEREHFDENVRLVRDYLEKKPLKSGSLCLFACWALDFLKVVPVPKRLDDLVWIDSSPFIRPLAELQDEYENVAVVVADNKRARIFLVSSAVSGDAETVRGNIKNHVKKGGWSQQRYERRRDGELLHYAREIVERLRELDKAEEFRRVILVGGKEIARIIHEDLPQAMQARTDWKAVDLGKGEDVVNREIMELFTEQERESERDLWEKIRVATFHGNRGALGLDDVLEAARDGRVDTMIVERDFKAEGRRCRDCENLQVGAADSCAACGLRSLFEVEMVNEIVELLKTSGAETDFADPIATLSESGHIAALLRY